MAPRDQQITGSTGSVAGSGAMKYSGTPSISSSMSVFPKGRGRADIYHALQLGSDTRSTSATTKPGPLALKKLLCIVCWFPEGMERLTMTDEPEVGMKHGEVGTKFQASANWI